MSLVDEPILKKNIFEVLFDSAVGIVEKGSAAVVNAAEGLGSGLNAIKDGFQSIASVSLGASHVSSSSPEMSVARVHEPEIAPVSQCAHEFNPADLGCLAPPALPMNASRSTGAGIGA